MRPATCLVLAAVALTGTAVASPTITGLDRGALVEWDGSPVLWTPMVPVELKPHIDPLLTPAGHAVTWNPRAGNAHHHGLWLTWGPVDLPDTGERVDFWSEGAPEQTGRIVLRPGTRPRLTMAQGRLAIVAEYDWQRISDGLLVLTERRQLIVHPPSEGRANLISIVSEQTAARDLVIRSESNEPVSYYGFCVQLPSDMHYGRVVTASGAEGRAEALGDRSDWCAYSTTVVPARGIALFDHPLNARHSTSWFQLDGANGFISASLVGTEDYELKAGETLRLAYGALAFDGDAAPDFIDGEYRRWKRLQLAPEIR